MRLNKKRIASFLSVIMAMIMFVGCAGAQKEVVEVKPLQKEESPAVSVDFIGGKDVMPLAGYFAPYVNSNYEDGDELFDSVTDEAFEMFADAGINLITYSSVDYSKTPALTIKSLELAEKYGIGLFVTDSSVTGKTEGKKVTKEDVAKRILPYQNYPAFSGMYVIDEPDTDYLYGRKKKELISSYGDIAKVLQHDLGILTYLNALPNGKYPNRQDIYHRYLTEFCETFQPKVLMYDYYPYGNDERKDTYFWNLAVIRTYAKKYSIPFWCYVQAGAQWDEWEREFADGKNFPNEGQFNWNVNTSLAAGAQGIQYFPLLQPTSFLWDGFEDGAAFERNGLIGAAGNKNQWYFYAQNINKHIAVIDEILMNSVNKGVVVNGKQAKKDIGVAENFIIESGTFQELQSVSGEAMIGCFNYQGKTALYVVNYSDEYAQKITLKLNDTHKIQMIQNAEESFVQGKSITLDMAAGEGILLVIE